MMQTPILAIDAAIGPASACLMVDDQTFYAESDGSKPHSQIILSLLEDLMREGGLQWPDIQAFAVATGPGSFTGVRVIAATIAGINASLKRPVMGVSSLAITACQADTDAPIWVLEDARSHEVFIGKYQDGCALKDDVCRPWDKVKDMEVSSFVAHAEPVVDLAVWQRYPLTISRSKALASVVRKQAKSVDVSSLETVVLPTYLQVSQAERSAMRDG